MKNIFKSWRTTLIGLLILAVFAYSVVNSEKGFEISDAGQLVQVLIALGFIVTKDGSASHSRVVGPRPGDRGRTSTAENKVVGPRPGDRG